MELQHWTGEVVARDFGIPYLTVLSAHGPDTASGRPRVDWRDAAAVYKRWATTQPWTARTLCERDDVPSTLLSGAAGVIVGLQDGTGYSGNATFGPQLERLPAYVAEVRWTQTRHHFPPFIPARFHRQHRCHRAASCELRCSARHCTLIGARWTVL